MDRDRGGVAKALSENSLSVHAVRALASIDAKEDEEGLLEYPAGQDCR
jgi:cobalamin biosynthesis protein CbiG